MPSHFNKIDELLSMLPLTLIIRTKQKLRLTFTRLEAVASAITRAVEAVERRKDIEQQMATLVDQVTSAAQAIEEMMKVGFKGREDDVKKSR